ncbi:MAG: hypothetical protein ABH846_00890 [Patescibacteria group bacterium]
MRQFIETALSGAPHLIEQALCQLAAVLPHATPTDIVFIYVDETGQIHVGWAREPAYYRAELAAALATTLAGDLTKSQAA